MLFLYMDNKLMAESADSHALDIGIGYFTFDSVEERQKTSLG